MSACWAFNGKYNANAIKTNNNASSEIIVLIESGFCFQTQIELCHDISLKSYIDHTDMIQFSKQCIHFNDMMSLI